MEKKHKKISAVFEEHIKRLSMKHQRNIWKAVAFYWHVHLYERHKFKKIKPDLPDYELIQQAAVKVYGKDKAEPVLNTLLELGIQPHPFNTLIYEAANNRECLATGCERYHPFNTLIYEAANGISPTTGEKIHSFCFGCIVKFETEYRDAVKELVEKGIIKKTGDQEWIDYLKKCNSYVPELAE